MKVPIPKRIIIDDITVSVLGGDTAGQTPGWKEHASYKVVDVVSAGPRTDSKPSSLLMNVILAHYAEPTGIAMCFST